MSAVFVFIKPTHQRLSKMREEHRIENNKHLSGQEFRKQKLQEKLEFLTLKYTQKDGFNNFLSQLERKMGMNYKGEKFVNFDQYDFKGWRKFVEGANIDKTKSYVQATLKMFLDHLQTNGFILPQVKYDIWKNEKCTVKFYWNDTNVEELVLLNDTWIIGGQDFEP